MCTMTACVRSEKIKCQHASHNLNQVLFKCIPSFELIRAQPIKHNHLQLQSHKASNSKWYVSLNSCIPPHFCHIQTKVSVSLNFEMSKF